MFPTFHRAWDNCAFRHAGSISRTGGQASHAVRPASKDRFQLPQRVAPLVAARGARACAPRRDFATPAGQASRQVSDDSVVSAGHFHRRGMRARRMGPAVEFSARAEDRRVTLMPCFSVANVLRNRHGPGGAQVDRGHNSQSGCQQHAKPYALVVPIGPTELVLCNSVFVQTGSHRFPLRRDGSRRESGLL